LNALRLYKAVIDIFAMLGLVWRKACSHKYARDGDNS
jgi:hypothetical protein